MSPWAVASTIQVHVLSRLRILTETLLVGMVARANCGMMLAQADKLKALELRKAAMQVSQAVSAEPMVWRRAGLDSLRHLVGNDLGAGPCLRLARAGDPERV